jgi:hypothetical protein
LVKRLLQDTPWKAGGWKDALRQCPEPGVMVTDAALNRIQIGGEQLRCTLVMMGAYAKVAT